jgi:hypothetical protein
MQNDLSAIFDLNVCPCLLKKCHQRLFEFIVIDTVQLKVTENKKEFISFLLKEGGGDGDGRHRIHRENYTVHHSHLRLGCWDFQSQKCRNDDDARAHRLQDQQRQPLLCQEMDDAWCMNTYLVVVEKRNVIHKKRYSMYLFVSFTREKGE